MDWSETVRRRYAGVSAMGRGFALAHRRRPDPPVAREEKKRGLFSLFHTDAALIRRIETEASAIVSRYAAQSGRAHRDYARTVDKRLDLIFAGGGRFKTVERELADIKRREKARHEQDARIPPEERPISHRAAARMAAARAEASNEAVRAGLAAAQKNVTAALRRMREDEEYERMRREPPL